MWLFALGSCELLEDAPTYLTDVSDLRMVGMVLSPPEARPGELVLVSSHVADPREGGFDMLLWSCVPFDGGCLEALVGLPPTVVRDGDWTSPIVTNTYVPLEAERLLVVPGLELTVLVWALVCEPGLCPLIDEVDAQIAAPFPDWHAIYERLAHPEEEIRELPVAGVNLAVRRLFVSNDTSSSGRNENPTIAVLSGPLSEASVLEPGQSETWLLRVTDAQGDGMHAYGFTTAGEITDRERVVRNEVELTWTAPDRLNADHVRVWMVIEEEDEDNGSAVLVRDFYAAP